MRLKGCDGNRALSFFRLWRPRGDTLTASSAVELIWRRVHHGECAFHSLSLVRSRALKKELRDHNELSS